MNDATLCLLPLPSRQSGETGMHSLENCQCVRSSRDERKKRKKKVGREGERERSKNMPSVAMRALSGSSEARLGYMAIHQAGKVGREHTDMVTGVCLSRSPWAIWSLDKREELITYWWICFFLFLNSQWLPLLLRQPANPRRALYSCCWFCSLWKVVYFHVYPTVCFLVMISRCLY